MCTGKCSRFVGLTLIPLSLLCILANALLLVPDGKTSWTDSRLSLQVWLLGGFVGGGLMVSRGQGGGAAGLGARPAGAGRAAAWGRGGRASWGPGAAPPPPNWAPRVLEEPRGPELKAEGKEKERRSP